MTFCWVTLPVKSLETSLAFYQGILGLPIDRQQHHGDVALAMLGDKNQPKIELIQGSNAPKESLTSAITIGITVDDLDQALRHVTSHGVRVSRGPISPGPHIRFAYVLDPDGYEVQLVESK